ncbi:unnamed protein product [Closterium sp. NIES-64]|nr:unnamed protein product [Closterium sp. NIES-64]
MPGGHAAAVLSRGGGWRRGGLHCSACAAPMRAGRAGRCTHVVSEWLVCAVVWNAFSPLLLSLLPHLLYRSPPRHCTARQHRCTAGHFGISGLVDTLLLCSPALACAWLRPSLVRYLLSPPSLVRYLLSPSDIPVKLPAVARIGALRIALPTDLRPKEARQAVLDTLRDVTQRFPDGLPILDPVEVSEPDPVEVSYGGRKKEGNECMWAPSPQTKEARQVVLLAQRDITQRFPDGLPILDRVEAVLVTLRDATQRFPDGLPILDPVEVSEDMGITDESFLDLVHSIDQEESKLATHPLFKAEIAEQKLEVLKRRGQLLAEAQRLKMKTRESQDHVEESQDHVEESQDHVEECDVAGNSRSSSLNSGINRRACSNAVATSLHTGWCSAAQGAGGVRQFLIRTAHGYSSGWGHIDADGVVQLKGRAACVVTTGDELLVTELMLEGAFNSMDPAPVGCCCQLLLAFRKPSTGDELLVREPMLEGAFHSVDPHQLVAPVAADLKPHYNVLREAAQHIARVQIEEKIEVDEEEYVDQFRPTLMGVFYQWSKEKIEVDEEEYVDQYRPTLMKM